MLSPDKQHATWSASSTEANWFCPGRLALIDGLPETTNEAADWGTCCHELAEMCLREGGDAVERIGLTLTGKQHSNEVDEEMAETAQMYVDYVRSLLVDGAVLQIEQRFSLDALKPPFDAGGTADAVIYKPKIRNLEVVDLKGGRGVVVAVTGNKQMRTYALGAVLANPALKFDTVTVTIVQPRAAHKDGRIRSETFHTADLIEWTSDLLRAMEASALAIEVRSKGAVPAVWNAEFLNAGDHCKFCPAAGFCPALEQKATDAAGVWFDDLDQPRISNRPDDMTPEALAKRLDMLDMIQDWINEVRAYAHCQAESGVEIPGYQLVEKIGNRAWTVGEDTIAEMLVNNGISEEKAFTKKIVSPAQAEKLLGAKKKKAIEGMAERPVRGTNLVKETKTTRPSAVASVHKHFDVLD